MTIEFTNLFQSAIILFLFFLAFMTSRYFAFLKRKDKIKNFESYLTILQYHMDKAYDIILKDRLLIYSIEATKVDDKEFNSAAVDFVHLTRKILGPKLTADFISFYGNEDTFAFNLIEYFNTKYENDEIRESAQNSLIESDVEEGNKYEHLRSIL